MLPRVTASHFTLIELITSWKIQEFLWDTPEFPAEYLM